MHGHVFPKLHVVYSVFLISYRKSKQKQVLSIVDPGLHSQMQELTPVNGVDESSIANGAPNGTDNVPSQEEHSVKDEEDSGDQSHLMAETTNGHPHASNHVSMLTTNL